MAYTAPTSDFVTSTLNGAIVAADETITIGTGLDIPATNGILQIDYDSNIAKGSDNGPETIAYATYTTGTGALSGCTRGLNGTTGVSHANGAKVQCGPSVSYWGTGSIVSADIGAVLLNANLATTAGDIGGAWKSFTPTFTLNSGGAAVWGNGTFSGYYTQIGKTVHFWAKAILGSTTNFTGLTSIVFTLPVTASSNIPAATCIGRIILKDADSSYYFGSLNFASTTTGWVWAIGSAGSYINASEVTYNIPHSWAATDYILIHGTYEAA